MGCTAKQKPSSAFHRAGRAKAQRRPCEDSPSHCDMVSQAPSATRCSGLLMHPSEIKMQPSSCCGSQSDVCQPGVQVCIQHWRLAAEQASAGGLWLPLPYLPDPVPHAGVCGPLPGRYIYAYSRCTLSVCLAFRWQHALRRSLSCQVASMLKYGTIDLCQS